jgi:hypothetical protein
MKRMTWILCFALAGLVVVPSKSLAQAWTDRGASPFHANRAEEKRYLGWSSSDLVWRDRLTCSHGPCALPNVLLTPDPADNPIIVVSPENPKQFIAAALDADCNGSAAYGSADGGANWVTQFCSENFAYSEPTLVYGLGGTAFFAGIGGNLIITQNNGQTWSQPISAVAGLFYHGGVVTPWLGIDNSHQSRFANRVYIAATQIDETGVQSQISVSYSADRGNHWAINTLDAIQVKPVLDQYSRLAVGSDGTVYVAWQRCVMTSRHVNCAGTEASMMLSKSVDGGNTWSKPKVFAKVRLVTDTCDCAFFGNVPHTTVPVANPPLLAVDQHSGTLYAVMYNLTGKQMKVQLISSQDQGTTWSKPTAVAPPTETHDQFLPTLAVSSTGAVGVSWLDRRNDRRNILYQPFTAVSTDGGASFGKNYALASNLSDTYYNYTLGDYMGNVWAGQTLYAVWPDTRNAVMQNFVGGLRTK